MRKILALSLGVAATAAPPGAAASSLLSVKVSVTPDTAGTVQRPQGVRLTTRFEMIALDDDVNPIVTGFEVWHGPGLAFDRGKSYAACRLPVLAKLGPDGCPPTSLLGSSRDRFTDSSTETAPSLRIVNGPGRRQLAYMTLQRPARVRAAVSSTVTHNARSVWPHRIAWAIPRSLQVVAGIPIAFNHLNYTYGATPAAPLYVSTTSCPKGGWRWRVRVHTERAGVLQQDGRTPCKRR